MGAVETLVSYPTFLIAMEGGCTQCEAEQPEETALKPMLWDFATVIQALGARSRPMFVLASLSGETASERP